MTGCPRCTVQDSASESPIVESSDSAHDFWSQVLPVHTEGIHLWDIALDCLENIGTLHGIRKPLPHENWRSPIQAEQRLLNQLDAVLACGESVNSRAADYVRDSEIPDPGLAFAVMLVLGCVSGTDSLQVGRQLLEVFSARDPDETQAATEALSLAPNPNVSAVFSPFLEQGPPALRSGIARLLSWRGELTAEQVYKLLHSGNPDLMLPAIDSIVEADATLATGEWIGFLQNDSESVVRAEMRLSFAKRQSAGRHRAIGLIADGRPEFADSALWVGLAGDYRDWAILEKLLTGSPSPLVIAATGYWGYPEAFPTLLDLLKSGSNYRADAAFAIERITAADLSHWNSDSQDLELANPEEYERWWNGHSRNFLPNIRMRRGRALGTEALLAELENGTHTRNERTITHLELISRFEGRPPRFRADDFIPYQEQSILQWKRCLAPSLTTL
jgi:HEAT repeat protein